MCSIFKPSFTQQQKRPKSFQILKFSGCTVNIEHFLREDDCCASDLKSPTIIFTGSSTLPRSISESRRLEPGVDTPKADSVLTLQLEGALGGFMSVNESGSREDTLSPLVSQKLGERVQHSLF